jgi:hypothetical protein
MKIIRIPAPVPGRNFLTGETLPIAFPDGVTRDEVGMWYWLQAVPFSDARWAKSIAALRQLAKLEKTFPPTGEGDWRVEDADWATLKDIVDAPAPGINLALARITLPFAEAVLNAETE